MIVRDGEFAYGFIHNPRTAGTNISAYLKEFCGGRTLANLPYYVSLHSIYAEEVKYRKFPNHYLFGFIRNPFSREYSLYQLYHATIDDSIDFKTWCLSREDRLFKKPQYGYFCDINGNVAVNIFRYENRTEAINTISQNINTNPEQFDSFKTDETRVYNADMSYTKMYDNEMIDYLSEQYAVDLEAFGYYFDGYHDTIKNVPFEFTEDTMYYGAAAPKVGFINV